MPELRDLTGQRFSRLLVLRRGDNVGRNTMWVCRCDCGLEKPIARKHLLGGRTRSCNCLNTEAKRARITHGGARLDGRQQSDEYLTWKRIRLRCLNPKATRFCDWGGRGIKICPEWINDYAAFLRDMGRRPSNRHSIDRYPDPNGNYEPGNCRWATPAQQARNSRQAKLTEASAEAIRQAVSAGVPRKQLRQQYGISSSALHSVVTGRTWRTDHV